MTRFLETHDCSLVFITGLILIIASLGPAYVLAGNGPPPGVPDHLMCYKVLDKSVQKTVQNKVVYLHSPQFDSSQTCRIVGNYREFCVPVTKQLAPDDDDFVDGMLFQQVDRICYEIRSCVGPLPPMTLNVKDQFGQRDITFWEEDQKKPPAPYTLCTPAEKCNPACIDGGADTPCTIEYAQGVCLDNCTCVFAPPPETGCCQFFGDPDTCSIETEADCDDEEGTWFAGRTCNGTTGACETPPPPTSNCCESNGGLGCDDLDCENLICGLDPFCCDVQWDGICAGEANDPVNGCAVCQGGG